ncbi:MAG: DUF5606 domain-containing protein [Flavobacteriaceae bacterium]|nr:DUF5606 domain-containing protein [Flavobacteriaceae bacterium]
MELKNIVAISGKPGLYEVIARSNKGVIVQSLLDQKKMPIGMSHNVSALNEILVYTYGEEVPLWQVLKNIFEQKGKEAISHKEPSDKLLSFFREVLPNFDEERVYASNVKKILQWYHLLLSCNFDFASLSEEIEEVIEE